METLHFHLRALLAFAFGLRDTLMISVSGMQKAHVPSHTHTYTERERESTSSPCRSEEALDERVFLVPAVLDEDVLCDRERRNNRGDGKFNTTDRLLARSL